MIRMRHQAHVLSARNASGFTLMEIMVAMTIIGIISLGLISSIMQFSSAYQKLSKHMQATQMALGVLENVRRLPDSYRAAILNNSLMETGVLVVKDIGILRDNNDKLTDAGLQQLMPGLSLSTANSKLSGRTSMSMRDIASQYQGLQISDTTYFAGKFKTGKSQPRPPAPLTALNFYGTSQRVRPTLLGALLDIRIVERYPIRIGLMTADQAPILGHVATDVVRNPKQMMDRTGSDGYRLMTNAQSALDLEPIPYSEADTNGQIHAAGSAWTYDFTNKMAIMGSAPGASDWATYQLQLFTPPLVHTDWVDMVNPSDDSASLQKETDYLTGHALGLTVAYPSATQTWTGGKANLPKAQWEVRIDGFNDPVAINVIRDSTNPVILPVTQKGYEAIIPIALGSYVLRVQPYLPITVRARQISAPNSAGLPAQVLRVRFVY